MESERQSLQTDIERIRQALGTQDVDIQLLDEEEEEDGEDSDVDSATLIIAEGSSVATESRAATPHTVEAEEEAGVISKNEEEASEAPDGMQQSMEQLLETALSLNLENLPANPEICLALNKVYQEYIGVNLKRIEMALMHNREKQAKVSKEIEGEQHEKLNDASSNKKKGLFMYGTPFFRDVNGMYPPANDDTLIKKNLCPVGSNITASKPWTKEDSSNLETAVRADALKLRMRPLLNKKAVELEKKEDKKLSEEELQKIDEKIKDLDDQLKQIKKMSVTELLPKPADSSGIDWLKISVSDMKGYHDEVNCRLMWSNVIHPAIRKTKWTSEEDVKLRRLVKEHNGRDWVEVAKELGTGRSAFQCLHRYKTKLISFSNVGKWSPKEDSLLLQVVENVCIGGHVQWHIVEHCMEGRSQEECVRRWEMLQCNGLRQRWTTQEDKMMMMLMKMYGTGNWEGVAESLPNRHSTQVRERWVNSLDPSLNFGNWTPAEDKLLLELVEKHGKSWTKIAPELPGRTDNMLLQRHKRLVSWQVKQKTSPAPTKKRGRRPLPRDLEGKPMKEEVLVEAQIAEVEAIKKSVTTSVVPRYGNLEIEGTNAMLYRKALRYLHNRKMLQEIRERKALNLPILGAKFKMTHRFNRVMAKRKHLMDLVAGTFTGRADSTGHAEIQGSPYMPEDTFPPLQSTKGIKRMSGGMARPQVPLPGHMISKKKSKNRQKMIHNKVNWQLCKALQDRITGRKRGRPKSFMARKAGFDEDEVSVTETENKIRTLLMTALLVDVQGALYNAKQKLEQRSSEKAKDVPKDTEQEVQQKDEVKEEGPTPSKRPKRSCRSKARKPGAVKAVSLPTEEEVTEEVVRRSMEYIQGGQVRSLHSGYREMGPTLDGSMPSYIPANYRIPPLPPTVASLNTFTLVLLSRRELLEKAGLTVSELASMVKQQGQTTKGRGGKGAKSSGQRGKGGAKGKGGQRVGNTTLSSVKVKGEPNPVYIDESSLSLQSPSVEVNTVQSRCDGAALASSSSAHVTSNSHDSMSVKKEPMKMVASLSVDGEKITTTGSTIPLVPNVQVVTSMPEGAQLVAMGEPSTSGVGPAGDGDMMQEEKLAPEEKNKPWITRTRRMLQRQKETHEYKLFRERVRSLFLWPALLSTISTKRPEDSEGSEVSRQEEEPAPPKKKRKQMPMSKGRRARLFALLGRDKKAERRKRLAGKKKKEASQEEMEGGEEAMEQDGEDPMDDRQGTGEQSAEQVENVSNQIDDTQGTGQQSTEQVENVSNQTDDTQGKRQQNVMQMENVSGETGCLDESVPDALVPGEGSTLQTVLLVEENSEEGMDNEGTEFQVQAMVETAEHSLVTNTATPGHLGGEANHSVVEASEQQSADQLVIANVQHVEPAGKENSFVSDTHTVIVTKQEPVITNIKTVVEATEPLPAGSRFKVEGTEGHFVVTEIETVEEPEECADSPAEELSVQEEMAEMPRRNGGESRTQAALAAAAAWMDPDEACVVTSAPKKIQDKVKWLQKLKETALPGYVREQTGTGESGSSEGKVAGSTSSTNGTHSARGAPAGSGGTRSVRGAPAASGGARKKGREPKRAVTQTKEFDF